MCVTLPGQVVWIGTATPASIPGRIDGGDAEYDVDLIMVPDAAIGDFVIAHSGYAIRRVEPAEARRTRSHLGVAEP